MIAIRQPRARFGWSDWFARLDFEPLRVLPLLTIVLLLSAEWTLRRRWGYA